MDRARPERESVLGTTRTTSATTSPKGGAGDAQASRREFRRTRLPSPSAARTDLRRASRPTSLSTTRRRSAKRRLTSSSAAPPREWKGRQHDFERDLGGAGEGVFPLAGSTSVVGRGNISHGTLPRGSRRLPARRQHLLFCTD